MKRLYLILTVLVVLVCGSNTWATCPEAPNDNGICDTLRVTTPDAVQTGAGPYTVRFPLWITHDVPDPVDSIAAIVIPLCFTHTNPAKYCSVSAYWNSILWTTSGRLRSIFRHLVIGTDTTHNWMMDLYNAENGEEWNTIIIDFTTGTPNHFWLSMVPTGSEDPRFGTGNHTLLAMMTFAIQDTMHVTIDSCLWPPSSQFAFVRSDGPAYIPRDNMPATFWIGPPRLQVLSPNGGEQWARGSSHNITWLAENFVGGTVKIEYSTNNGSNWTTVIASTANNGSYTWNPIPNTPSPNCLVRVSNTAGGTPVDQSDAVFAITAPDFNITATPDTQTVQAGNSTSYTVNLGAIDGFSNAVTLSMSIIGSSIGITSDFTSNPVTPPGSSTMNVHTTVSTTPKTYKLIVTGTYTSLVHKDTVNLIVTPPPDFTIDATPDTQQVIAGNGTNYNVILLSQYGFSNPCTLTTSSLPAGVAANFDINPVVPSDTAVMSVSTTADVTPPGTYMITITATEQTKIQKSTNVYLVVKITDFTIDATPESLAVNQGGQVNYNVALTALNGFSSACTLTVSGLPANVTGAFAPPKLIPPGASTLTITADMAAVVGKYSLIVTGTQLSAKSPVLIHSDTVTLVVTPPPDFTIEVKPDTQEIHPGGSVNLDAIVTSLYGFSSPCTLSISGLPGSASGGFAPNPVVPTDTSILHINAEVTSLPDTYAVTVTATELIKGKVHSVEFILIVTRPDSLMVSSDTVCLAPPLLKAALILRNQNPISAMTIPLRAITNSPAPLRLDSVSFRGTRIWNWEEKNVYIKADTVALKLVANMGGGTPSLPPGEGSIARIYFHIDCDSGHLYDTCYVTFDTIRVQPNNQGFLFADDHGDEFVPYFEPRSTYVALHLPGDLNCNCVVDVGDVIYLINYLYKNGPEPCPQVGGDVTGDGIVDVSDVIYLINYFFKGGPPPSC